MARRINAPGIEVNEIDRSSYEQTVDNSTVGTTTLVFGFADKGEDYTVRWMNTMNTFIRTYGYPTNEAERYFYNSAHEIINGGGVCYTAKLPYYNDSQDNFVYTSYTIDNRAQYISSPLNIVDSMKRGGVEMCLSDFTVLEPSISSMCETIMSAVQFMNEHGLWELVEKSSYLSDGFVDYLGKTTVDLIGAVTQLGDILSAEEVQDETVGDYYERLNACFRSHVIIGEDYTLRQLLFYPYLIPWIKRKVMNPELDFNLTQMDDFIEYVKKMSNFGLYSQSILDNVVLSSPVSRRTVTLQLEKILNGESEWYDYDGTYEDIQVSSEVYAIQRNIKDAFGDDATIDKLVDQYSRQTYLHQFRDMYYEMLSDFGDEIGFTDEKYLLDTPFTDFRVVDDSLTSMVQLKADISGKNEIMSFDNYDKFLIKELRVPLNKIYIVDKTRGKYEKDSFGNEILGIMPVIVTPANALFYQDTIMKSNSILSDYNVIEKVRNSYRRSQNHEFNETVYPFDSECNKLSSYNNEGKSVNDFAGMVDYLGAESFFDKSRVNINDFTVSEQAAEYFPTIKFINDRLDRKYLNQIGIVVFKVFKDQANEDKISFQPVESFVGSLDRRARDEMTGERTFIDDVVNANSDYINVFSNANIAENNDPDPYGLKNASVYRIDNQTACSMGFYQRDTRKHIHVSESIYRPLLKIFEKSEDRNTLDFDIMIDGGVSNIAQFIASTQLYTRNKETGDQTGVYVRDEFQRYGIFDFDNASAHLFKLDNKSNFNVWKKVVERFDDFAKNTRKDIIFLADGPRPLCLDGNNPVVRRTKPENTIKNSILPKMKLISGIFNSSYSAGYLNWFYSLDHYTGEYMWMPPSIKAVGVYLYTDNHGAYWDAPAGLNRGKIRDTLNLAFNPTNEEAGQIYINSWNYAVSYPLDGIVLEGQRTFQKEKTALDRVNVRRLMLGMEKVVRNLCKYFNYEGNTEYNRERMKDSVDRYLEQVRAHDGISQYITVCDERNNTEQTIDNNELHISIAVRPIKTIEFIILNFIATNQSTDVSEVMESELGT